MDTTTSHNPTTPPCTTLQLPQSTPIKISSSTILPFTTTQKYRLDTWDAIATEMTKSIVGPMPPKQFLDEFLPIPTDGIDVVRDYRPGCYDDTVNAKKEVLAYPGFVSPSI